MSARPRASRVLLLCPSHSYRAPDFLAAAAELEVSVTLGSDHRAALAGLLPVNSLELPFEPLGEGVSRILEFARAHPLHAVIGTDDETCVIAALAARGLRLVHNDPEAVARTRDKHRLRQALSRAGLRCPRFRRLPLDADAALLAGQQHWPCVLKPLALSGSRGVIRADDQAQFRAAFARIRRLLRPPGTVPIPARDALLVEDFLPGREVALEGLLRGGVLTVLALFDKPDPLDGPYFAETLYVTPSRLPESVQSAVCAEAERAARALGLREGPVHAELRVNADGAWLIELAARTIGGLCSRALRFAAGMGLEALVLRHALGRPLGDCARESGAAGVMMLPVPRAGRLVAVRGTEAARGVPGVTSVRIAATPGEHLVALPDDARYLGFVHAAGPTPGAVEAALREAGARLRIDVQPCACGPGPRRAPHTAGR